VCKYGGSVKGDDGEHDFDLLLLKCIEFAQLIKNGSE
jgi:hypothetical protein